MMAAMTQFGIKFIRIEASDCIIHVFYKCININAPNKILEYILTMTFLYKFIIQKNRTISPPNTTSWSIVKTICTKKYRQFWS